MKLQFKGSLSPSLWMSLHIMLKQRLFNSLLSAFSCTLFQYGGNFEMKYLTFSLFCEPQEIYLMVGRSYKKVKVGRFPHTLLSHSDPHGIMLLELKAINLCGTFMVDSVLFPRIYILTAWWTGVLESGTFKRTGCQPSDLTEWEI